MSSGKFSRFILLRNVEVPVQVLKGPKGRVKLSIREGGLVVQTATGRLEDAQRFILEKETWILKNINRTERQSLQAEYFKAGMAEKGLLFGRPVTFVFQAGARRLAKPIGSELYIQAPAAQLGNQARLAAEALFGLAKYYFERRAAHWAQVCDVSYNRLNIKDVRSRWGSCSSLGNINLNWHLVLLDKSLSDYVIVHELMHLHEMNHSERFWAWVDKYIPDYADRRRQLKDFQWIIGIYNLT